jgi:ABC-type amino acid transport substrate-binding protein/two-component sensor histidine kinase
MAQENNIDEVIIVGGDNNFPPYEFLDKNGYPTGYNIELMKEVARIMGLDIQIQLATWDDARSALEKGEIDVLAGMFYSEERDKEVDFSDPHSLVYHMIFIRNNTTNIKTIADLNGKEIIVQKGDIMHDFLIENKITDSIILVEAPIDGLRLLASGKHDCAIFDDIQGLYLIEEYGLSNLNVTGPPFYPREYCFAVKEGNTELLNRLNEGLQITKSTGRQRQLHDKWIQSYLEKETSNEDLIIYILIVIFPLGVIIALSFFWSWTLRKRVSSKTFELNKEVLEHKKAEEKIKELNNTLKLLNKILRHDIANNLTVTSMALEMMETKDSNLKDKAMRSIVRSTNLIEQIRELESLVSDNKNLKVIDLNSIITDIKKFYSTIKFNIEGNCLVLADDALSSVIDNVIRNAVIHGKTKKIDIKIKCIGDFCEIRISDYGKGIPDEIKERIFDEEFSYGNNRGSGLGLYIVKKVIDRYDGSIKVENNAPHGTTFVLNLKKVKI